MTEAVPTSAKQIVLDHIRNAIRTGALRPGKPIRERELAEACSVSRSAIREAIVTLVGEGTLVQERGYSPTVRQFSREELWAHHQIREALEGLAAGLAAARHDQVHYHPRLRAVTERMNRAVEAHDGQAYLEANYAFHALIVEMSGNPFIQGHIDQSHATQVRMQAARFLDAEGIRQSHEGHQEILDAIIRGDQRAAEDAMRSHIRGTRRSFMEMPDIDFRSDAPASTRRARSKAE